MLSPEQQVALDTFEKFLFDDKEQEFILGGFSGCGKTYLTEHMLVSVKNAIQAYQLLNANRDITYEITATTNKAADVLSKRLKMPVSTIYSSLKVNLRECYKTGKEMLNFSHCSVKRQEIIYFIDEASYLSTEMIEAMRDLRPNAKFVFIGDRFQLPPIGILDAPTFDLPAIKTELTQIQRQNQGPLQQLVYDLKEGVRKNRNMPIYGNGLDILVVDGANFQRLIDAEFSRPDFQIDDAKILAYQNSEVTAYAQYTRSLQGKPERFQAGDQVIVNTAYADIPTDSMVTLSSISKAKIDQYDLDTWYVDVGFGPIYYTPDKQGLKDMLQKYAWQCSAGEKHWKEYFELKNTFIDLRDPNACTVHKSQGSTYPMVFIDMHDLNTCRSPGLLRRLKYVGLSRASQKVIIYGR